MAVRSLNKVMLIGNLTRDPEIRYTPNGTAVCSFGMATNRSWKDANGEIKESAEFHNIVAWAKMAEICNQILAKGMKVYVEGSISTRSWEDEASKTTKYKTEIRITDLILLDSKGKSGIGSNHEGEEPVSAVTKTADELLDEITAEESGAATKAKAKKKADAPEQNEDPLADMPF